MNRNLDGVAGPRLAVSAGIAEFGNRVVVWGKDLHGECLNMSFVHYCLFCSTSRWFDAARARVWERLWISTGYPDARLWCNRVAGYLGSARVAPGFALSAAIAASNSVEYGFRALSNAYALQREIPEALAQRKRWFARQLARHRRLAGYGRPVRGHDERLNATFRILAEEGYRAGAALKRADWVDLQLRSHKGIEMNVAGAWAAIAIDFEMSHSEFERFMLLMLVPGYLAVYTDQSERPPMQFLAGYQSPIRGLRSMAGQSRCRRESRAARTA